jgi:hypothetical protein
VGLPQGVSAGRRTLRLAVPSDESLPQGYGWATVYVKRSGAALVSGRLGDGTAFSSGFALERNGTGLLLAQFRRGAGAIFGTLDFLPSQHVDPSGAITWRKAPATAGTYPVGFQTEVDAWLAPYVAPGAGVRVLNYVEPLLDIEISKAGLVDALTDTLNVSLTDKMTPVSVNALDLKVSVDRISGRFSGSFLLTGSELRTKFDGIFDQSAQLGLGVFNNNELSGAVKLSPTAVFVR